MRDVKVRYGAHPAKLPTGRTAYPPQKSLGGEEARGVAYTSVHTYAP